MIDKCERTELAVPNFQRFFVWKKDQIANFFDSIFHGYYIGSLLFWSKPEQKIGITAVKGVNKDRVIGDLIILDGQQRVASIYYALRSPDYNLKGSDKKERTFFYVDFGAFLKKEGTDKIKTFTKELDKEDQFDKLLFHQASA